MHNVLSGRDRAPRAISIFNVRLINVDTTRARCEKIHRTVRPPCARCRRKERHFFYNYTVYAVCAHNMRFTQYRVSLNMRLNNNLTTTKNKITEKCIHNTYNIIIYIYNVYVDYKAKYIIRPLFFIPFNYTIGTYYIIRFMKNRISSEKNCPKLKL